jgi:hypothetical protein
LKKKKSVKIRTEEFLKIDKTKLKPSSLEEPLKKWIFRMSKSGQKVLFL